MARESLRGFLQIGFFLAFGGICSALAVPKDGGEFVVSLCSSFVGLIMIIAVMIFGRLLN